MKRIVWFVMSTLTVVVLLFGYHTSTSSRAAGGETAFVSTPQAGSVSAQSSVSSSVSSASPTTAAPAITTPTTSGSSSSSAAATTTDPTTAAAPTTTAVPTTTAAKASTSTITGDVTDTQWGPVQVQLTVENGKITAVSVLQYPNGNGRDQEINSYALPILVQETISAQSAKIDMVSGATVTSDGYLGSLQSALDKM
jgi:uncharacterized protein with FMN-binding domain